VRSATVRIDGTAPVVTWSSHPASYKVDQRVTITCSASDPAPGSGLASSTCAQGGLNGVPAYTLGLGSHTLSAPATDVAGNAGSAQTSYSVTVSIGSLCTLTTQLVQGSSLYAALNARQKAVVDALSQAACGFLTGSPPTWAPGRRLC
jgi:hypothetical protein